MKGFLKRSLISFSYVMLFCIITGIIFYYGQDLISLFTRINWWVIGILVLLHIPVIALYGYAFNLICVAHDLHLRWQEWAGLSFIANFLNQLLPYRPGLAFRFFYLKKHYKMGTAEYIYLTLLYLLCSLIAGSLFLAAGWLANRLPETFNHAFWIAMTILIGSIVLGLSLIFANAILIHLLRFKNHYIQRYIHKIIKALATLRRHPFLGAGALLSYVMANLLTTIIFYTILKALHTPFPFMMCILLAGMTSLAMILPITPGNIGVLETLIGTLTHIFYKDFSLGFGVMALYRASQWIPAFILGSFFSFLLAGSLRPSLSLTKLGAKSRVD